MRAARILATAALSSLALALGAGATTAHAAAQPTLTVSPSPARPGSPVTITLNGGCEASTVSASSGAFTGSVTLTEGSTDDTFRGTATIRRDARAGSHRINISCPNGSPSTFTFTVGSTTPSGGAQGGLGGSITDMDATKVATGAVLVTLAAAGGTFAVRRRVKN
ncbi:hypothetical protein ACIBLA_29240 [Streptomyces sp. NPDC050433]|uniref:hypothetical protein n=1 Tax=unclassified Streptomyces TaxID=2593676 RepID=UPI0034496B6E